MVWGKAVQIRRQQSCVLQPHTRLLHILYLGVLNLCVLLNSMIYSNLRAGYILLFEILNYR